MKKIIPFLLFSIVSYYSFSQNQFQDYLLKNKEVINLENQKTFNSFDTSFYQNNIFLFGENHGSAYPHDFDFLLFKHLYEKEKVRFYLAEVDHIKANLLNSYLKDGDEKWLKKVFQSWQKDIAQWNNESNYNKYKKLHTFYQSLPANEKFTIIGIDVIQDYSLVNQYVSTLLQNKKSKIALVNQFIATTDTVSYKNRKITGQLARKIQQEIAANKQYKKEFKKNFSAFELFIKNAGYTGNNMYRDSIMYRTFKDLDVFYGLQNKKVYGFLGFYHGLQTSYEKSMPFAAHLKKDTNYNKVVSLQMLAIHSKVLLPYIDQVKKMMPPNYVAQLRKENPNFPVTDNYVPYEISNDNTMMKMQGIEDVKAVSEENTTTIFRINNPNSPYSTSKNLAEVTGFQSLKLTNEKSVTTDAYQYIVLFRNSPAGIPILK
jgi:hypothetical protein